MAPEVVLDELDSACLQNRKRIDIWALGMTLFVVMNPNVVAPYQPEKRKTHKNYRNIYKEAYDSV